MARLSGTLIERIPTPTDGKDAIAWDSELKGFGIRVKPSGARTFFVNYRNAHGQMRRISIGRYGTIPPSKARKMAVKVLGRVASGEDPAFERHEIRNEPSFRHLAEEYLQRYASQKKSGHEDERILTKDVLPNWRNLPVRSIVRRDVIRLINSIGDRGAPIAANRTLALIRKIFNFGIDQAIVESNPSTRIKPPGKEQQRDRVLSEDELRAFWERLAETDAITPVQAALKLILATAQRPGEVINAESQEFDLASRWWTIPAERSKNGLAHRVPLSRTALEILRELDMSGRFLFPSPRDPNASIGVNALSHAIRRNLAAFGIQHFTPHDLRRTAASQMASMGIQRLVIAKVLNHVESGITAVYDRHGYDNEKKTALDSWSLKLTNILEGKAASILPFVRERA